MCLLKNWTNGQLRPVLLLEKRQEPLFLFTLLKLMGKKASGRTLKVEISSFALISFLMFTTLGENKFYSCAAESYHCGNSTIISSFHFCLNIQEELLKQCILYL